ncbi:hypothetical protein [Senegalia massiliensis]|uniref:Uncharacterized protein n=1 Tax=Senegalia massiliensis TaxID=1720316 RepID=A0A845QXU5_9CLOT|nr:hypothetical protein [Senegalia massiliensis]NBI06619.1 hypothetical protein [Senegalia massiliensis]
MNVLSNVLSGTIGVIVGGIITYWSNCIIQKKKIVYELQQENYIKTKNHIEEISYLLERIKNKIEIYQNKIFIFYSPIIFPYNKNDKDNINEIFNDLSEYKIKIDHIKGELKIKINNFQYYIDTNELILFNYMDDFKNFIFEGKEIIEKTKEISKVSMNNIIEFKNEYNLNNEFSKNRREDYDYIQDLIDKNHKKINERIEKNIKIIKKQQKNIYGRYFSNKNK